MARNLGTLEYLVDIDTSGVYAGAAEVEAVLKGIPDETVNLQIDTNVESLRKARAELVKYQKLLKSAMTAGGGDLDRRTKAYKALPEELKKFVESVGGGEEAMEKFSIALDRNAAYMSEWTYVQRIASDAADRARRATNDQVKAQENQIRTTRKETIETAKLEERIVKLNAEIRKREKSPLAQNTEQERRELARMRVEVAALSDRLAELNGDVEGVNKRYDEHSDRLANMIKGLTNVRVHLGFFSLSIRQLLGALAVFGPILSGVIGGISALVGAVGTAAVGAFGLATAAGSGFLLSLIGIGAAVKPLFDELSTATKAATDYQKQVLETGKNSEEARDKLEEYRTTVKNLPKDTQDLIAESGKLYNEWAQLTDLLRRPFFETAGVGIQTLTRLMPTFKNETQSAFTVVADEIQGLLRGLGSLEGQQTIETLMRNNTRALPGFIQGLGSVTTAIARLAVASSSHLPRISENFRQWSATLAGATGRTNFQNQVNGMMEQLTGVGRVLTATGRLLVTFFSAGASAGQQFTTQLAATINRWNAWMKSTAGQQELADFFKDSITELKLLYNAVSPIIKIFARWTEATRPISQAVLRLVAAVASAIEVVTRLGIVVDLAVAASLGFFAKKVFAGIKGLVAAYQAVRAAILGVAAAQTAQTATAAASTRAMTAQTVALGAQATTLTRVSGGAVAARGATTGLLGAGSRLVGFLGGPWGIAIGAAVTGLILYGDKLMGLVANTQSYAEQARSIRQRQIAANSAIRNAGPAIDKARTSYTELKDSVKAYNAAVEGGRRPEQSLGEISRQSRQVATNQKQAAQSLIDYISNLQSARGEARNLAIQSLSGLRQVQGFGKGGGAAGFGGSAAQVQELTNLLNSGAVPSVRKMNKALSGLKVPAELRNAIDTWLVTGFERLGAKVNVVRQDLGKVALPPRLTQQVGQLFAELPKQARANLTAAFSKMEPEAVRQTTRLLQAMASSGKTKQAIKLAARVDAKTIDSDLQAIRRKAKQLNISPKKVKLEALPGDFNKTLKDVTGRPGKKDVKLGISNLEQIKGRLEDWVDDAPTKTIRITPELTTSTVTVNVKKIPANAEGGYIGTAKQEGSRTSGGRFTGPTFLVGEENRPEYVIATNPAYRKNNVKYWMQAGAALGIPGFANGGMTAGASGKPKRPVPLGKKNIPALEKLYRQTQFKIQRQTDLAAVARREEDLRLGKGLTFREANVKRPLERVVNAQVYLKKLLGHLKSEYADSIKAVGKSDLSKEKKKKKLKELRQKRGQYVAEHKNMDIAIRNAQVDLDEFLNEVQTGGTGLGASPAVTEALNLLSGNYALGMQYGSNMFRASAGIGSTTGVIAPGGIEQRSAGAASRGKVVNVTNNYQEPPADPHTWSKQLEWEVGVA